MPSIGGVWIFIWNSPLEDIVRPFQICRRFKWCLKMLWNHQHCRNEVKHRKCILHLDQFSCKHEFLTDLFWSRTLLKLHMMPMLLVMLHLYIKNTAEGEATSKQTLKPMFSWASEDKSTIHFDKLWNITYAFEGIVWNHFQYIGDLNDA